MRVLLLGGGAREHAIGWKLMRDEPALELISAPGNPGLASLGRCVPASLDPASVVSLARAERADLVVVGPEGPLAAGVSDAVNDLGVPVFGPSQAAARIESSKRFAKELMFSAGVPTAGASWHSDVTSAGLAIRLAGAPVVIKASGLAAGKGVIVCHTEEEANAAVDQMLLQGAMGAAGREVLVEEFMDGEELSVFAVSDGEAFVTLIASQDHKRLLDGDRGPNTGGMGAYAPVSIATDSVLRRVEAEVISPTLEALRSRGTPFRGLLYVGLMLTDDGPKVVEFNCRFGDPETQAVLPLLDNSLLELLLWSAGVSAMSIPHPLFSSLSAVTTVIASPGYPSSPRLGAHLQFPHAPEDVTVFQAGTKLDDSGGLVTAGGRVVSITAVAPTLDEAQRKSVEFAERVELPEKQFRRDIGWHELTRRAGAT